MTGQEAKRLLEELAADLGLRFGQIEVSVQNGEFVYLVTRKGLKPGELEAELAERT